MTINDAIKNLGRRIFVPRISSPSSPCYCNANLATVIVLTSASIFAQDFIPDHERTPGAINHSVTQDNIAETICVPGWTKTVRPSSSYTSRLKSQQMHALESPGTMADYEEDHLVSLCVGGAPHDHHNLWPQARTGQWTAAYKDQLEASVCRAVCKGAMTLEEGREIFLRLDWTKEYEKFFELQLGRRDSRSPAGFAPVRSHDDGCQDQSGLNLIAPAIHAGILARDPSSHPELK